MKKTLLTSLFCASLLFTSAFTANRSEKAMANYAKENKQNTPLVAQNLEKSHQEGMILVDVSNEASLNIIENKMSFEQLFEDVECDSIECDSDFYFKKTLTREEKQNVSLRYTLVLKNKSDENLLKTVNRLNEKKAILLASPNYFLEIESTPNDAKYVDGSQWAINGTHNINVQYVWDNYTTGSYGTCIGIIDTGILDHEDLVIDRNKSRNYTRDTIFSDHGTRVAGICGAIGNNEKGITGVCQQATLVAYQVSNPATDPNTGETIAKVDLRYIDSIINDVNNNWDKGAPFVLNLSASGYGSNDCVSLLNSIRRYKGLFVWAAGNEMVNISEREDRSRWTYYAACENLISVGNYTFRGNISATSNYGEAVDIFAPGTSIYSTAANNEYLGDIGTSFAAPFVSGTAALLHSYYRYLPAKVVKKAIMQGANNVSAFSELTSTYYDIKTLNVRGAFEAARELRADLPLEVEIIYETSTAWKVRISNPSSEFKAGGCYTKTMSEYDAERFNVSDPLNICRFQLHPERYITTSVEKVGSNGFISAYYHNGSSRVVTYIGDLRSNGLVAGSVQHAVTSPTVTFPRFIGNGISINRLSFTVEKSTGFIIKNWVIKIKNNNAFDVDISYNSKMCFENDAKNWSGLSDVVDTTISGGRTIQVTINGNLAATCIVMSMNYTDVYGLEKRLITTGTSISKNSHNEIETTVTLPLSASVTSHF